MKLWGTIAVATSHRRRASDCKTVCFCTLHASNFLASLHFAGGGRNTPNEIGSTSHEGRSSSASLFFFYCVRFAYPSTLTGLLGSWAGFYCNQAIIFATTKIPFIRRPIDVSNHLQNYCMSSLLHRCVQASLESPQSPRVKNAQSINYSPKKSG